MKSNELLEKKWKTLLGRIWLFRLIPFIDFVLVAGSLATGKVHENSDFDVIIGVREKRIFTVRGLCWLFFGIFGWRRSGLTHKEDAKDKICLNHFISFRNYCLKPPYNSYWQELYQNLVPVFGEPEKINKFFNSNDWLKPRRKYSTRDSRHNSFSSFRVTKFFESNYFNWFWNFFEWLQKLIQMKMIERSSKTSLGYKPRIVVSDDELELHPDTGRIEAMLELEKRKK